MIKTFRKFNKDVPCYEVRQINLITGEFNSFNYIITTNEELVKFSQYNTNTNKMGYKKPEDYLKRAKELGYFEVNNNFLDHYPLYDPFKYSMEQRQEFLRLAKSFV